MAEADPGASGKKSWSTADAIHLIEVCNTYRHDYFAQHGRDWDYKDLANFQRIVTTTTWPSGLIHSAASCCKKFDTLRKNNVRKIL